MIYGIGVDKVDLERVRNLLLKSPNKFQDRCFTQSEVVYSNRFFDPAKRLGARFAGKEAVMKSLGKGWRQINWRDIEITGGGKPEVILHGKAEDLKKELGVTQIHISLTHEENDATAFAIAEVN